MLQRLAFLVAVTAVSSGCSGPQSVNVDPPDSFPRNVILYISDGAGPASFTLARDYLRATNMRQNLYLDEILVGTMETTSASHLITGSASAATAMASGVKTNNLTVGLDPEGKRLTSIFEKAEVAGIRTGIIVTREVTDATPAAFTAHVLNRYDDEEEIAIQQLDSGIDLLVGGGLEMFLPQSEGGKRTDGRNLVEEARATGYNVATDRRQWEDARELPVLALLATDKLAYEVDRNPDDAPSLAEMVKKAINMLDREGSGFFLMVEGSRIDLAGHDNDAVAHVEDMIAYDEAVKEGLDFAKADGETLVISLSDHETGGLSIGRNYSWFPEKLSQMTASHDSTIALIMDGMDSADLFRDYYGIDSLSTNETARLDTLKLRDDFDRAFGEIIGDRLSIDWTSLGHTAVDVNVYAYGPGSDYFRGHYDNTHIGISLPVLMGLAPE